LFFAAAAAAAAFSEAFSHCLPTIHGFIFPLLPP
jgi:hypothetical protein